MSLASTAPLQSGPSAQAAVLAEPFEPASLPKEDKVRGFAIWPDARLKMSANGPLKKSKVRGLFGLGKKKTDDTSKPSPATSAPSSTNNPASQSTMRRSAASPIRTDGPASPGRGFSTSSPRLASPAGSQIFERDVQEAALIPNSPAIPSHIITENHVPPVLDASSEAITDDHLNPDSVEIITHASHQPAAATISGTAIPDNISNHWQDDIAASLAAADFRPIDQIDNGSNSGGLDNHVDVRRLSFISFADVVQAEHQGHAGLAGSRDSLNLAGLTSLSSVANNRSPSPIRSPVSSTTGGAGTSPPNSKSASLRGLEQSPSRKPLGSPVSTTLSMSPPIAPLGIPGEVNVETMAEALKRTGSGDLSGVKSHPGSPVEAAPSR